MFLTVQWSLGNNLAGVAAMMTKQDVAVFCLLTWWHSCLLACTRRSSAHHGSLVSAEDLGYAAGGSRVW